MTYPSHSLQEGHGKSGREHSKPWSSKMKCSTAEKKINGSNWVVRIPLQGFVSTCRYRSKKVDQAGKNKTSELVTPLRQENGRWNIHGFPHTGSVPMDDTCNELWGIDVAPLTSQWRHTSARDRRQLLYYAWDSRSSYEEYISWLSIPPLYTKTTEIWYKIVIFFRTDLVEVSLMEPSGSVSPALIISPTRQKRISGFSRLQRKDCVEKL